VYVTVLIDCCIVFAQTFLRYQLATDRLNEWVKAYGKRIIDIEAINEMLNGRFWPSVLPCGATGMFNGFFGVLYHQLDARLSYDTTIVTSMHSNYKL
jgi:hypothetical protein